MDPLISDIEYVQTFRHKKLKICHTKVVFPVKFEFSNIFLSKIGTLDNLLAKTSLMFQEFIDQKSLAGSNELDSIIRWYLISDYWPDQAAKSPFDCLSVKL